MKISDKYSLSKVAGQTVIMPKGKNVLSGGKVYRFKGTGAWFAEQLAEEITFDELLDRAAAKYSADREVISSDLKDFIESMKQAGIIAE